MSSIIQPRGILLDLDGTLADSLSVMRLVYQQFLQQFQCQPSQEEFDALNGPPLVEVIRRLKISHALEMTEEQLLENYVHLIRQIYLMVLPHQGAATFLYQAKKYHCAIGIVTSNSQQLTQQWLEKVNLAHLVDFIIAGEDVQCGKPHPEPYLLATKRLSYPASDIIAIEDSLQGVTSAVASGLKTFALVKEKNHTNWPNGVQVIDSFTQLSEQLWAAGI